MSELTDRVRKMLAQAQVFAKDTPFEAVARVKQALAVVDESLVSLPSERRALEGLRTLVVSRLAKYERGLSDWQEQSRLRGERYVDHERHVLAQPLRTQSKG
jgi:hypothetical protein